MKRPDCIAPTVVRPITVGGLLTSTRGRRAAVGNSASAEIVTPGQIGAAEILALRGYRVGVVAVPKSQTTSGRRASRPNIS